MARLVRLHTMCFDCSAKAVVELHDQDGIPRGRYCWRHGKKRRASLNRLEHAGDVAEGTFDLMLHTHPHSVQ